MKKTVYKSPPLTLRRALSFDRLVLCTGLIALTFGLSVRLGMLDPRAEVSQFAAAHATP
ncbi:hypothetical protein AQS8620_00562 [Aquimixticola soesokkakensis]|uniref:Uncharacterized protein n=1 Tax=Aquimixticola soesokkakensis TaxID=1519096 RepID=A0A1Y5RMH9_9RHOB|nr:hypothetical protein [Aquimixticola soesokkakensis]SLN20918.1 hypothetical protein AQS8620_00562 [Aquimixticola soesokkakensis]